MPGVGQQRDRIAEQAEDHFQNHEPRVEGDPDGERPAETGGRVKVALAVVMGMVMPAMIAGGFVRVSVMAIAVMSYERGAVRYSGPSRGVVPFL